MSANFDVIVIGAGHNGLTAAALLAQSGRRVLVLEKRECAGGLAAPEEFHPGHHTSGLLLDTSGVRREIARALGLEGHGLNFREEPPVFIPQEKGPGILLHRDPVKARAEIAKASSSDARGASPDAARYLEYREFLSRIRPLIKRVLDHQPPGIMPEPSEWLKLLKTGLSLRLLGEKDMFEVLRIVPMCAADWLNEWFATPALKAALAAPALQGSFMGPWSAGTVANLLVQECVAEGCVEGGPAALAAALEKAAKSMGAEIRLNAAVRAITLKEGRVTGVTLQDGTQIAAPVVVASTDPKRTLLGLIAPADLPLSVEKQIRVFKTRGTTAKVNLALKAPLEFACRPGQVFEAARTGEQLDDLERAFDAVKYRQFSKRPLLEIRQSGKTAEILASFAPYDLAGGWTPAAREAFGDAVVSELCRWSPKAKDSIIFHQVLTPADLEERYGLTGGHLYHGEHALDQLYILRPSADLSRYATPLEGLFLGGSGSHPGGGITCAPGALAARAVLKA